MNLSSLLVRYALIGICLIPLSSCIRVGVSQDNSSSSIEDRQDNASRPVELSSSRSSASVIASNTLPRLEHQFAKIPFEEQAQVVTSLIQQEKFSDVEVLIQEHIRNQTSTRGGFYYPGAVLTTVISEDNEALNDSFLEKLDQWVSSDPNSSLALVARSQFYYQAAWEARGGKFYAQTPKSAKEEYIRLLQLSIQDLESAIQIDPQHPLVLLGILGMGHDISMDREVFESYFEAITEQIPFLPQAFQKKQIYLEPQWHGSEKELLSFVREVSASAPRGSVVPFIVSQAHEALCHRYVNKRKYYSRPEVWADLESSYTRIIEDFPNAGMYPAWYADKARIAGKTEIAKKYINLAMEREPNHPGVKRIRAMIF